MENVFDTVKKKDEYYLFYEMMMQALKTDNVKEGVNKSLELLKLFLQAENIFLYKMNDSGIYTCVVSDLPANDLSLPVNLVVNKAKFIVEAKEIFKLDLNLSPEIRNVMLIHLKLEENEEILAISNYDNKKELAANFWQHLKETLLIILKRAMIYERNIKAIKTDLLTGLDNRNSYEMRIRNMEEDNKNLVLGIFDLFRLKYVNDNYNHMIGDTYIKETAAILAKYWPKYRASVSDGGMETLTETGHMLYRVGGDEFVLLTDSEDINLTNIKANLAAEEVSMIKLPTEDNLPLGLNFGIVFHREGESIKDTYAVADKLMSDDKRKMYTKYGLDRRR